MLRSIRAIQSKPNQNSSRSRLASKVQGASTEVYAAFHTYSRPLSTGILYRQKRTTARTGLWLLSFNGATAPHQYTDRIYRANLPARGSQLAQQVEHCNQAPQSSRYQEAQAHSGIAKQFTSHAPLNALQPNRTRPLQSKRDALSRATCNPPKPNQPQAKPRPTQHQPTPTPSKLESNTAPPKLQASSAGAHPNPEACWAIPKPRSESQPAPN